MREGTVIHAPVQKVWEVFSDFETYPEWNPFIRRFEGTVAPFGRVSLTLDLGLVKLPLHPQITVFEPPHRMDWRVEQGSSFLYAVDRHFEFADLGEDRTHVVQSEESSGLLAPLIDFFVWMPVIRGYRRFNRALKERAEGGGEQ